MGQVLAGSDGRGEGGDDGITGTGHIEHFTRPRRQVQRRLPGAQQGHAVLATGHQQGAQVQVLQQLQALATSSASSAQRPTMVSNSLRLGVIRLAPR